MRPIALLALALAACAGPIELHAPAIAPAETRGRAAHVELQPIEARAGALAGSTVRMATAGPADVLMSGMRAELNGRALEGGEPGGYRVGCVLDRFALRTFSGFAGTSVVATLYADLGCRVERVADGALVWRGALRARAAARTGSALSSEAGLVQDLADRVMSDASRELSSDLAVRVLALGGGPSERVFAGEEARQRGAGVCDTAFGAAALTEASDRLPALLPGRELEPAARAATWNAMAMAAGPGDPWRAGTLTLDGDPLVRFFQYKALAREASPESLALLRRERAHEGEVWLTELVDDALALGGLGLPRRK